MSSCPGNDNYQYYKEQCPANYPTVADCSADCLLKLKERTHNEKCYKPAKYWCGCQAATKNQVDKGWLPNYCTTPKKQYTWVANGPRSDCITKYEPNETDQKDYRYCVNRLKRPIDCYQKYCQNEVLRCYQDLDCTKWLTCLETSPPGSSSCPGAQTSPVARSMVECINKNECPF